MRIPDGWEYVSDYCIKREGYTICRVGSSTGWEYELWQGKQFVRGNLPSADAAIKAWEIISNTTNAKPNAA